MKIYRAKNYESLSRTAANIIAAQVIMKPDCVLGLATGSSPIGTYEQLVKAYNNGDLDFSEITTVISKFHFSCRHSHISSMR